MSNDQHEIVVDRVLIEDILELAFGDGAHEQDYTLDEAVDKLREIIEN